MNKIYKYIFMGSIFLLSSCGGIDSQINDYKGALQDGDIEKAASILNNLSKEELNDDQIMEIKEIHEEYFDEALIDFNKESDN